MLRHLFSSGQRTFAALWMLFFLLGGISLRAARGTPIKRPTVAPRLAVPLRPAANSPAGFHPCRCARRDDTRRDPSALEKGFANRPHRTDNSAAILRQASAHRGLSAGFYCPSRTLRTVSAISRILSGFSANARIPISRAFASVILSEYPVHRITGISGRIRIISPARSTPVM
jgi:hypothetical protein